METLKWLFNYIIVPFWIMIIWLAVCLGLQWLVIKYRRWRGYE